MEEFLDKSKRTFSTLLVWSASSVKNLGISIACSVFVMVLGYLMMFTIPNWVISTAKAQAVETISQAEIQHELAKSRWLEEKNWFTSTYTENLPPLLTESNYNLTQAENSLKEVDGNLNPDQKLQATHNAKSFAETSLSLSTKVINTLDENLALREQAFAQRDLTNTSIETTASLLAATQQRFDIEKGQYHPKYTNPLSISLNQSTTKLKPAAIEFWHSGSEYLPNLNDQSSHGDPKQAMFLFDQAKAQIDQINTLMTQVTSELDYQAEAKINAASSTQKAEIEYTTASKHVVNLKGQTGYWLNQASNSLSESKRQLELANNTLNQLIDGYVDFPVAYEAAKKAISLSQQAITEADAEVALAQKAFESAQQTSIDIASTKSELQNASGYYTILQTNHSQSEWDEVASNINNAQNFIASAEQRQRIAAEYASMSVQRFADSYRESQSAIDELSQARSLAQQIVEKSSSLEGYRIEWPNAKYRAESTIESERPRVNQYGSYDYSASNDFQNAIYLLEQAISEAFGLRFEPAVDKANQAESTASGTGNRAYSAYEDEMARQQAAEEAARRAAEEQSSPSCCDSSPSYDYEYDSGGGGGSDYGGGGSDSVDPGGGSDSDW